MVWQHMPYMYIRDRDEKFTNPTAAVVVITYNSQKFTTHWTVYTIRKQKL
jgi:hypothetical protein